MLCCCCLCPAAATYYSLFFFLIGCDVHLFILKELHCSGDLTLHGPRGWLNATGLSGEEPGWKQTCLPGEAAQTWQAFVTFPSLDSFFLSLLIMLLFCWKLQNKGAWCGVNCIFPWTWPEGSSDACFSSHLLYLKAQFERRTPMTFFKGATKVCAVESADGDHNYGFRWITKQISVDVSDIFPVVFTSGCGLQLQDGCGNSLFGP